MIAFDVFISYSTKDKPTADAACAAFEAAGIRCWIAPRDIVAGADWGAAIVDAIDHCRMLLLIFSSHANESPQIRNEVVRAASKGVPILPVRIEDIMPTKSLAYYMGSVHWLDAMTPPLQKHLDVVVRAARTLLDQDSQTPLPAVVSGPNAAREESLRAPGPAKSASIEKRRLAHPMALALSALFLVVCGAVGVFALWRHTPSSPSANMCAPSRFRRCRTTRICNASARWRRKTDSFCRNIRSSLPRGTSPRILSSSSASGRARPATAASGGRR
jgi:hypothetical protein